MCFFFILMFIDLDSNLSDGSYLNASLEELNNIGAAALDTSDLGNSIQSSLISKEGVSSYLDVPNRCSQITYLISLIIINNTGWIFYQA